MSADAKTHDYHLVEPSPWPIVAAGSTFVAAVGATLLMAGMGPWIMLLGFVGIGWVFWKWGADIVAEAHGGYHTPIVQLHLRYGMLLFILSEVAFFGSWFWAYFDVSLLPDTAQNVDRLLFTEGQWPPPSIQTFDPWDIPFINTVVLLTSGVTVTWAHHALIEGDRKGLIQGLTLTVLLGAFFSALQAYEYAHAAFAFGGNIYSSTFYLATGFHGVHVLIGTIFLLVCLLRAQRGHFTPERHFGFEAAAWYWHFVDVVWLFLFVCIYVWGAGPSPGAAH